MGKKKKREKKVFYKSRRKRFIRTIGLDTDVFIAFMLNRDKFSMSIPKILLRKKFMLATEY